MKLIRLIFSIAALFIIAYFFPIHGQSYPEIWKNILYGVFHGILFIPNWIISYFDHSHLFKASSDNVWYNISWWLSALVSVLNFIENIYSLFKRKN